MQFVVSEDRVQELTGVRLLLLSLKDHCPDARVHVIAPSAPVEFVQWATSLGGVTVGTERLPGRGWDVKPHALLSRFEDGEDEVVWLDSDIIVDGDVTALFAGLSPAEVAVAEDCRWGQAQGGDHRTRSWGLEPGRELPVTANTCVVRVTRQHLPLLHAWAALLADPEYVAAQGRTPSERPIHQVGDQEVFTALLGAREFADVPIHWVRRGRDIAQLFGPGGYTTRERLGSVGHGTPVLVHAMGRKPWHTTEAVAWRRETARDAYDALAAEVSPYRAVAQRYREELDDTTWLDVSTPLGRLMRPAGATQSPLRAVPLVVVDESVRALKAALGRDRYRIAPPGPARTLPHRSDAGGSTEDH